MNRTLILIGFTMIIITGCSAAETPTPASQPTITPIPVYQYNAPTEPPQLATIAAMTAAASTSGSSLDPQRVERGRDRYVALECGACHGENGEGTDDGSALTNLTLSQDDFVSFMRSGGSMGADHQYSTNRLSESGGRNLYEYLLSLSP